MDPDAHRKYEKHYASEEDSALPLADRDNPYIGISPFGIRWKDGLQEIDAYFNDKSQQKSVDSDRATDTDQTTVRTEDHLALPPPSSPPTIDKTTTRKLSLQEMAQESSAAKLCLCKVDMTFPPVEHSDYVSPQSPPCPTKAASELPDTIRTLKRKSEAVEELQESPESVSARVHGNIMTPSSRTSQKERSIGYEGDTEDRKKKQCKHSETAPSASSDSLEFAPGFMRTAINTFTPINAIHAASQPPQGLDIATATQEADLENPAPKQQSKKSAKQAKPTPSQPAPTGAPTHAAPTAPAKPAPSAPALLPKPPPAAPPAAAAGAPAGPKKRRRVEVRALTAAETAAALRVRPADLEAMKRPDVETLARQLGVYWPGATKAGQIDRIVQWQGGVWRVVGGAFDEVVVRSMGNAERMAYLSGLEEVRSPKSTLLREKFKDISISDDVAKAKEIEATVSMEEQRPNTAVSKMEDIDMEDAL